MSEIKRISKILLVSAIALLLVGCGYEETKEYELLTLRRYDEVTESGLFTVKKDVDWYIEYTYETEEGIQKECFDEKYDWNYEIGEETKVVLREGENIPILCITLDKYKELYGIKEEGGIE